MSQGRHCFFQSLFWFLWEEKRQWVSSRLSACFFEAAAPGTNQPLLAAAAAAAAADGRW